MRTKALNRLSAARVRTAEPGYHEDGGGLRLIVEPDGKRHWAVRFTLAGERKMRRLGVYPDVTLEQARTEAAAIRQAAKSGVDYRAEKKRDQAGITFKTAFENVSAGDKVPQ